MPCTQEISRRASDVSIQDVGSININKGNDKRRDSIRRESAAVDNLRRGSMHRGSLSGASGDEEDLEKKKMRAVLEMMGMQRKTQKAFTWDVAEKQGNDEKPKRFDTLSRHVSCSYLLCVRQAETKPPAAMSKDIAMKTLGLCQVQGQGANRGKAKTLNDYSEDDILNAFQTECKTLGKQISTQSTLGST